MANYVSVAALTVTLAPLIQRNRDVFMAQSEPLTKNLNTFSNIFSSVQNQN